MLILEVEKSVGYDKLKISNNEGKVKSDDEEGFGDRGAEVKRRRQRCFGCD